MSKKIFQRKRQTLLFFMIISLVFFVAAIASVAPGRKLFHKEFVDLHSQTIPESWTYFPPNPEFDDYLIKASFLEEVIVVEVMKPGGLSYSYDLEPFSDSVHFVGEIYRIRITSYSASFQIKVIGIRYVTTPILIAFSTVYGVAFVATVIVMRLPLPEEKINEK